MHELIMIRSLGEYTWHVQVVHACHGRDFRSPDSCVYHAQRRNLNKHHIVVTNR